MDEKIFAKSDVSARRAHAMSTEQLVQQTVRASLFVTYLLYSNPSIGVYRAAQNSPSLKELCTRNDLGQAFAATYEHLRLDPSKNKRFVADSAVMQVTAIDTLIQYPPIRRKLAGHEKEIILAMSESLNKEFMINKRFKPGKELYGDFGSTIVSASKLLTQAKPSLAVDLSRFKKPETAMKEIAMRAQSL